MTPSELTVLLTRLAKATKNQPTADDIDLMCESILDNRLSDEEIRRGYVASRDAPEPWWPKPGEFLARARRSVSTATVSGEADTIFQNLVDHPTRYGTYNPNVGTSYDRRKVESAHGKAAGIAFAAVASRFRNLQEESVPFVRREFVAAFEEARRDYGAPLTLAPTRLLGSPAKAPLLTGSPEDGPEKKKFQEMVRGFPGPSSQPPPDVGARFDLLRRQAREIGGDAA